VTFENVWTEKYRPRYLDEIAGQVRIVDRLIQYVEKKSMPHLMFAGKQGTGKTTAAFALARELYGDDWQGMITKLDASDERGINVVRDQIKVAASLAPPNGVGFRLILLDEADGLTRDAQHALRRTIERFSHITRFVLLCNYSNKIIAPIQSRCAVFRFRKVGWSDTFNYLDHIAKEENLLIDNKEKVLRRIAERCDGDVRRATLVLMDLAICCTTIKYKDVIERFPFPEEKQVARMIRSALGSDTSGIVEAYQILDEMYYEQGFYADEILEIIYKYVTNSRISPENRIRLVSRIAEVDDRLGRGRNEVLQLQALLEYMHNLRGGSE
jgi:replication factor C small subunit